MPKGKLDTHYFLLFIRTLITLILAYTSHPTHTHKTSKEMLERDLVELHTFTKMEQHIDTEWNELSEKLAAATAQIDEMQAEQQNLSQR